jgi:hypothetical protein
MTTITSEPQIILEEEEFQFDEVLLGALAQPKNRLLILKLEKDLEKFIIDVKRTKFEMKPMNPYQRLLVHRVAQYFKLDHVVADVLNTGIMDEASKQKRAMILFKSPLSRVPTLKLADLVEQPEEKEPPVILTPPTKSVMIMKRANSQNANGSELRSKSSTDSSSTKNMTLEQREEEYQKARARIFGSEGSFDTEDLSTKEAQELADEFDELMKLSSPKMLQESQPDSDEPPRILAPRVKLVQNMGSPNISPTLSPASFSPSPTASPHFGAPFSPAPTSPSMPFHPNLWQMYQMQMYAQMGNPPLPKPTFPFPMMAPTPYAYPMFPMAQPSSSTFVAPMSSPKVFPQHTPKQVVSEEPPKPAVVSHILEISWKSTATDETKDKFLKMLRDEGAALKLIQSKVIAVFKSASQAKKASERLSDNDPGVLSLWKLPTAHIPLNQLSPKSTLG